MRNDRLRPRVPNIGLFFFSSHFCSKVGKKNSLRSKFRLENNVHKI